MPRVRCGELSDRVVLRAMWRRISHDVKRAPRGALFICRVEKLLGCLREATLVSGGRVLMDETFARRAIEEPDGSQFLVGGTRAGALESGTKR